MSLFDIPLKSISTNNIEDLLSNKIPESRLIDYKRDYDLHLTDKDQEKRKRDFLADVVSFASTNGGDIVYGIEESGGIPISLQPFSFDDFDKEKLRLTQLIKSGVEPKINFDFKEINNPSGYFFIVRVFKCFSGPAMLNNNYQTKFYKRFSSGKNPLDYHEIRDGFTSQNTIKETFNKFRNERLDFVLTANLGNDPTKPFSLFHVYPMTEQTFNLTSVVQSTLNEHLQPYTSSYHYNLDGYITFSETSENYDYSQLFINGTIEYYTERVIHDGKFYLSVFENILLERLNRHFGLYKKLDVIPPFIISLTLFNFKNLPVYSDIFQFRTFYPPKTNILYIPEIIVSSLDDNLELSLRPIFDAMWRSYGISGSLNYTEDGQRKKNIR